MNNNYSKDRWYVYNEKIEKQMEDIKNKLRYNFTYPKNNGWKSVLRTEVVFLNPLKDQMLKDYFNNDICNAVSYYFSICDDESIGVKAKSFHAENVLFRLVSFWDYLFQVLTQFLRINFVADRQIRDYIINNSLLDVRFTPRDEGGYKVEYKPYLKEVVKKLHSRLKKHIVFLRVDKKAKQIKRRITKKYSYSKRMDEIFKLFKSKENTKVRDIRDEIMHRRSLGFRISIDKSIIGPGQGISVNPEPWVKINDLKDLIQKDIEIIKTALTIMDEIFWYDDLPNIRRNEGKKYYIYGINCCLCGSEVAMPAELADILLQSRLKIRCPKCKSEDTEIKGKYETNEVVYFMLTNQYIEYMRKNYFNREQVVLSTDE